MKEESVADFLARGGMIRRVQVDKEPAKQKCRPRERRDGGRDWGMIMLLSEGGREK